MFKLKIHTFLSAAAVVTLSLGFGGPKNVGAQPLEVQFALRIPGPTLVITRPLEQSLDQRWNAQQIIWDQKYRRELREIAASQRNNRADELTSNPLPLLSAALADAFDSINR